MAVAAAAATIFAVNRIKFVPVNGRSLARLRVHLANFQGDRESEERGAGRHTHTADDDQVWLLSGGC